MAMEDLLKEYFPFAFPIFFIAMWFVITTLLGLISGWYGLMRRYPDRREEDALLQLNGQSGRMSLVGMRGILNIAVCPSGLRLGIMKIFGIFCRDFFVPWREITVSRRDWLLSKSATIQFGNPAEGSLTIAANVANRLAASSQNRWPETGPFPVETGTQTAQRILTQWVLITSLASAFFIIVPRIVFPNGNGPPIAVAIMFPAIVFGIGALIKYFSSKEKSD
jgi:hypothetical protein